MTNEGSGRQLVDRDAMRGIRAKLKRAKEQLDYLQGQIDSYWEREPITGVSHFNEDFSEYVSHLRVLEPPPIEWAVIFGEAVHNLRSALDHAIYQVTIRHHGGPLKGSGFPIYKDRDAYRSSGIHQIRGLLPAAQTIVEELQPYNAPDPEDTVLWSIQQAWNQDKHRVIQLMAAVSRKTTLALVPPAVGRQTIFNGLKEDGAQIAHIAFKEPSPHVKVHLQLELQIVDKNAWNPEKPATVTYEEAFVEVNRIVNQFLVMAF